MLRTFFLLIAGLALVAVACTGRSGSEALAGEPVVRGPVDTIAHHATGSGILVRAGPGSRDSCGISATADAETRYFRRGRDGRIRAATRADLATGDTVEVYTAGPVMESCPLQGRAAALVIVGDG